MRHTEFPEFGLTMVTDESGQIDYIAWEEDDRADESDSQSDETD